MYQYALGDLPATVCSKESMIFKYVLSTASAKLGYFAAQTKLHQLNNKGPKGPYIGPYIEPYRVL